MHLTTLSRIWLCSLAMLLYMASAVRADFITGTLGNSYSGPGGVLNPSAQVMINDGNGGQANSLYAPGEVNWTVAAGPAGSPNASWVPAVGNAFQTFCIELTQDISLGGTYTYSLENLANAPSPGSSQTGGSGGMGQDKANAIAALWAADYGSIASATGNQADIDAAAFQLAIWKVEYDWGDTAFNSSASKNSNFFSSGNFRASAVSGDTNSAAAISQANTWLESLAKNASNINNGLAPEANLIALSSSQYQDQVMAIPPVPTPVPPTFYLAGIGGVVLIIYGYWRHRPAMGFTQR